MKLVFICAPFRGANPWEVSRHVWCAEDWAYRVAEMGHVPMCVQSMYRNFDETFTDEFWLESCREILRRCDAVFLAPGWGSSAGCNAERDLAIEIKKPVFTIATLEKLSGWK